VQFKLPPLYPIIDLHFTPHSLEFVIGELALAGVTLLQLRIKREASGKFLKTTREILEICGPYQLTVIVNDRADIAWLSGAQGVHLGQEDLPVADARRLLGRDKIIGTSTHNLLQAIEAQQGTADYVAIGPIYGTTSKERPDPLVQWQELKAVRQHVTKPLVAIGGITTENAKKLFDLGIDSVAVIRDLFCTKQIASKAERFLKLASS
jgi:thiamine-phosphate pyrophosphorylase